MWQNRRNVVQSLTFNDEKRNSNLEHPSNVTIASCPSWKETHERFISHQCFRAALKSLQQFCGVVSVPLCCSACSVRLLSHTLVFPLDFDPWSSDCRDGSSTARTQLIEIETFPHGERQRRPSSSSWPVLNRLRQTSRVPDYLRDVLGLAPGALVREQRQAVDVCRWCRWTQCKQCATNLNPLPHDCT